MQKRQILIVAIPLLIIISGYLLMKFFASKAEDPAKLPPAKTEKFVRVAEVKYSETKTGITAFGRIVSAQSISLVSEVSGKVIPGDIPLKAAQTFTKGQIVYRIDDTEAKLALQAQKSDFINSVAGVLPDIGIDFPDIRRNWESYLNQININKPLPELPEINNPQLQTFLSARGILNRYYTIKSAEEKIQRHVFRAPYNGSIAEIKVESGSVVNTGTQIGRIIRTDEMEAEIPVRVEFIKFIEKGSSVSLFSQDRLLNWKGRIVRIADFVDPATQSINVYVAVNPNPSDKIYEGFYVMAEIPGKAFPQAMEVPRQALLSANNVFVVEEGLLKIKPVTVIKLNPESFVFTGLKEGELLVVESLANATEGMAVSAVKESDEDNDKKIKKK